ncbi:MAG: hypothetical protein NTU61_04680, partial [Candidatus Altiarchaeota archaeon]|nr:hypothetical protein [Candidatus Altiarchaeota archaeon]
KSEFADLRMRTLFGGKVDTTLNNTIQYEMYQLSRDTDENITVDGRAGTPQEAAAIRRYAFALRDMPDLVGQVFCTTQWRRISSQDATDPKFAEWRIRNFDDMLRSKVLDERSRDLISGLVNESPLNRTAFMHALLNIECRFTERTDEMMRIAVEKSRRGAEPLDNPETGERFNYNAQLSIEALKNGAPPHTPEDREEAWGRLTLLRLFGKYGDRMKPLRDDLGNPYAPFGKDLMYGKATKAQRDALIKELAADLYGPNAEFRFLGNAMKEESFQQHCKLLGLDIKKEDTPNEIARKMEGQKKEQQKWAFGEQSGTVAATQLYLFMQDVHSKFRPMGEQTQITNTNGRVRDTFKAETNEIVGSIVNLEEGKFRIRLREFSEEDAASRVVSPRTRTPGFVDTQILRGVSIVGGAWAHEQRAISLLTEDPYTRPFMLNLARNQNAFVEFTEERAASRMAGGRGFSTIQIAQIIARNNIDQTHPAFIAVRTALDAGTNVDVDAVEGMLSNIRDPAINAAAAHLGIVNVNPERFMEWFKSYSNGLIDQNQAREMSRMAAESRGKRDLPKARECDQKATQGFDLAVTKFTRAYSYAKSFEYRMDAANPRLVESGVDDLRVVTLNKRGWARRDYADSMPYSRKRTLQSQYQLALDDFTAAWMSSRGDDPSEVLNPGRWIFRSIKRWWNDRFTNIRRPVDLHEDVEAMSGISVMNGQLSNIASISGEDNRKWWLGTGFFASPAAAIGLTVAGAASGGLAVLGAAAVSGVSIGLVVFSERLRLSEAWAERARDQLDSTPTYEGKEYTRFYQERRANVSAAETLVNSGDRSWIGFLRGNYATFSMSKSLGIAGINRFNQAASVIDPLSHSHLLHASTAKIDQQQQHELLIQNMYSDTYDVRLLKRRALEGAGRYYESAWGALDNPLMPPAELPGLARMYDRAQTNFNISTSGWTNVMSAGAGVLTGLGSGFLLGGPIGAGVGVGVAVATRLLGSRYVGQRWGISDFLNYWEEHPDEVTSIRPGLNNRSAIMLLKAAAQETSPMLRKGYVDAAKENWETARDKWRVSFQLDRSIVKADALRDLLTNESYYVHGFQPAVKHK